MFPWTIIHIYNSHFNFFHFVGFAGGGAGPPAPPRGGGRGPMTREEAQRLREEELAGQGHGKDCFIIPQANLDRFLPDRVSFFYDLFLTLFFLCLMLITSSIPPSFSSILLPK